MTLIRLSITYIAAGRWRAVFMVLLVLVPVSLFLVSFHFWRQSEQTMARVNPGIDLIIGPKISSHELLRTSLFFDPSVNKKFMAKELRDILRSQVAGKVIPLLYIGTFQETFLIGTSRYFNEFYGDRIREGRWWGHTGEVVIGHQVAGNYKIGVGDYLPGKIMKPAIQNGSDSGLYRVCGIIKRDKNFDNVILVPVENIWGSDGFLSDSTNNITREQESFKKDFSDVDSGILNAVLIKLRSERGRESLMKMMSEKENLLAIDPEQELMKYFGPALAWSKIFMVTGILFSVVSVMGVLLLTAYWYHEKKPDLALIRELGGTDLQSFIPVFIAVGILADTGSFLGIITAHLMLVLTAGYLDVSGLYDFSAFTFYWEEVLLYLAASLIACLAAFSPFMFIFRQRNSQRVKIGPAVWFI